MADAADAADAAAVTRRDDGALDLPPSPPLWATLLRGASSALSRPARPPTEMTGVERADERAPVGAAGGWFLRLVLRLAVIAVVLIVAAVVALYWFASSLN